MALPYEVNFRVKDGAYANTKKTAGGKFYIDSATTVANAITEAEGMLQSIADDCQGQIVSAALLIPLDIASLTDNGAADPDSNLGYKHRFSMKSAEGHDTILTIPAADPANAVSGTHTVDITTALSPGKVIADEIISRPLATSHDEPVTLVVSANEVWD